MSGLRRSCYPQGYELLAQAREERGLTLRQLEELTNVDFSRISRIERGAGGDEDTILALCRALDLVFVPAQIRKRQWGERREDEPS